MIIPLDEYFWCDDLNKEVTLRQWFQELLLTLWQEAEGFSGKRPFGNSGWKTGLATELYKAGIYDDGSFKVYKDGDYIEVKDFDRHAFDLSVQAAIRAL